MQPIGEGVIIGAIGDYNNMLSTEDYNMGAIEVKIMYSYRG
jgi:hypothetical protein